MKTTIKYLCVLAVFCMCTTSIQAAEMSVIVNNKNLLDTLTATEVRKFYLQNAAWPLGRKVRSVDNQGNDDLRDAFVSKVLRFTSLELDRYWIEQQYSRALKPPVEFSSDQKVIDYVAKNKGGIGVIQSSSVSDEVKAVLTISY